MINYQHDQRESMQLNTALGWLEQKRFISHSAEPVGRIGNEDHYKKDQTCLLDTHIKNIVDRIEFIFSKIEKKVEQERADYKDTDIKLNALNKELQAAQEELESIIFNLGGYIDDLIK